MSSFFASENEILVTHFGLNFIISVCMSYSFFITTKVLNCLVTLLQKVHFNNLEDGLLFSSGTCWNVKFEFEKCFYRLTFFFSFLLGGMPVIYGVNMQCLFVLHVKSLQSLFSVQSRAYISFGSCLAKENSLFSFLTFSFGKCYSFLL